MTESIKSLDLSSNYIDLRGVNSAKPLQIDDDFWWKLANGSIHPTPDRLLMHAHQSQSWDHWERHPKGEEVIIQISGETVLLLETDIGYQHVPLKGFQTVIVPRKSWHTLHVHQPADMIFITPGEGTEHRPVAESQPAAS